MACCAHRVLVPCRETCLALMNPKSLREPLPPCSLSIPELLASLRTHHCSTLDDEVCIACREKRSSDPVASSAHELQQGFSSHIQTMFCTLLTMVPCARPLCRVYTIISDKQLGTPKTLQCPDRWLWCVPVVVINELRSESVHSRFLELMAECFSHKKVPHSRMGSVQHPMIDIFLFKKLKKAA